MAMHVREYLYCIVRRLPLHSYKNVRNVSTYIHPLYFRATSVLLAEPLRKKKRIDPAILRAREEKRKKKLEKQIRRLEKRSGIMKPIMEIDVQAELANKKHQRSRDTMPLSIEEIRNRQSLEKEWAKYKKDQWLRNSRIIKSIMLSQENALKELKAASTELYEKAVEVCSYIGDYGLKMEPDIHSDLTLLNCYSSTISICRITLLGHYTLHR
ncbi:mitochondrial ribosomal protein L40 isoform X1 [Megachile rotundata]|uniref:mitochondrial ribosomal protein L40 isoform X1 n=1 Tax=Megachile rotundata TaxID=143995 RepID=UPI003FD4B5BF